jgi:hypothetical protein
MPDNAPPTTRRVSPGSATGNGRDATARITAPPASPPGARKQAVLEILGLPCIPLAAMAAIQTVQQPEAVSPYAMDVMAINMHSEPIADAVVDLANAYPVLGTLLDRIGTTTPFVALVAAVMALGVQLAENHGALSPAMHGLSPSLIQREEFARQIKEQSANRNG